MSNKIVFNVDKVENGIITDYEFCRRKNVPATEVFFTVNKNIELVKYDKYKKPQIGYESYYSSNSTSCSQFKLFNPETYVIGKNRYKMILEKNEDFQRAIEGLALFIKHGDLGNLDYSGDSEFGAEDFSVHKTPKFEIKYSSTDLEKRLLEV